MKQSKIRVQTVTCPQCHVEMFSRAHHDYRLCGCSNQTMVDGGFDYTRYGGMSMPMLHYRFIKVSKQKLFEDWNYGRNKFGILTKKGV